VEPLIYITDRSRIVKREDCERARYLNYDFAIDGSMVGIQRREMGLPQLNGIEIHEAHAKLLASAAGFKGYEHYTVDLVVAEMRERYKAQVFAKGIYGEANPDELIREQMALLEAMLRTFTLLWLPRILDEYDVVTVEKQMEWSLAPGLKQRLRFDTVLRRKGDGQLVILDYKSMSYISDAWAKKIERSRQTALYITAAQELFGESVEMAYLGMVKGMYRKDTAKSSPWYGQKIQSTPYLYAYRLATDVGDLWEIEWTAKKGYQKVRTYEVQEMKEWVNWLWHNKRNQLNEMFVFNPPFSPTPVEMNRVRELVVREELAYVKRVRVYHQMRDKAIRENNGLLFKQAQEYLDYVVAPMREESCFKYGEANVCQFYGICFNQGAYENVLDDPDFEPRVPHHDEVEEDKEAA
jgi:hypothetical protein